MASLAAADGVVTIAATPHLRSLAPHLREAIDDRRAGLCRFLLAKTPGLELTGGYEVPLSLVMDADPDVLATLTIAGGNYLLIESADTTPEAISQAVFKVRLAGLYPILAHPERSLDMRRERKALESLVANGDLFMQLTAASVEGALGRCVRRLCRDLLDAGAAHLVASDSHDTVRRPPLLSASCAVVGKDFGPEAAELIMHENPWRVINGGRLTTAGRRHRAFMR